MSSFARVFNADKTPQTRTHCPIWTRLTGEVTRYFDQVSKNAPAGSDVALAAVKSALTAANSARESIAKIAKQATEMAEANFAAMNSGVKEAKKKAVAS